MQKTLSTQILIGRKSGEGNMKSVLGDLWVLGFPYYHSNGVMEPVCAYATWGLKCSDHMFHLESGRCKWLRVLASPHGSFSHQRVTLSPGVSNDSITRQAGAPLLQVQGSTAAGSPQLTPSSGICPWSLGGLAGTGKLPCLEKSTSLLSPIRGSPQLLINW